MWVLTYIIAPLLVLVIAFFTLPFLDKPRQIFYRAIGFKHKVETQKYLEIETKPLTEAPIVPIVNPIEVINDVDAQPLMQQAAKAKCYVGMRVDCIGELADIEEVDKKTTQFTIHVISKATSGQKRVALIFKIDPALYRGIGLLGKKDPVHVSGIIERVYSLLVYLGEAKLIEYGKKPTP